MTIEPRSPYPETQSGPAECFDDFYRREWDSIVRLAWSMTGQRMIAQELAQDAMLAALRNWNRIARYASPHAWVRRVLLNRCTSRLRRASTELRLLPRLARERIVSSGPDEAQPPIWHAVTKLPPRQRQVVVLRYLEDKTTASIADILGIGEDTVRTHLRRAHDNLASTLADYAKEHQ